MTDAARLPDRVAWTLAFVPSVTVEGETDRLTRGLSPGFVVVSAMTMSTLEGSPAWTTDGREVRSMATVSSSSSVSESSVVARVTAASAVLAGMEIRAGTV